MTSPFQYNPDKLGDSYFEQGSLDHIVPGNEGRTLDYRRTPVRVKEIRELSGLVILEILDFEDKGNTWEIPFEEVAAFQFALGSPRADRNTVSRYAAIAERLDKRMEIACDDESRRTTLAHLAEAEQEARRWFRLHSTTLGTGVRSDFSYKEGLSPFTTLLKPTCSITTSRQGFLIRCRLYGLRGRRHLSPTCASLKSLKSLFLPRRRPAFEQSDVRTFTFYGGAVEVQYWRENSRGRKPPAGLTTCT